VCPQFINYGCRQRHGAALAALGRLEPQAGLGLLQALDHGNLSGDQIDVAPAQGANLAAAQAAHDGEHCGDMRGSPTDNLDQFRGLREVVGLHLGESGDEAG
jgi:hypothetical protein